MKKQILLYLFLFSVLHGYSQIQSIDPDTAMQGQNLTTTVTMVNGTIGTGSGPWQQTDVFLQQGANIIYCSGMYYWNWGTDYGYPYFSIPVNAALGLYDLHVTTYDFNNNPTNWTMANAFFIKPYAGTIEGDLYFDINQNGIRDGNDLNHHGHVSMNGQYVYAGWNGHFKAYLDTATYTVSYVPWWTYTQTSLPVNYTLPVPPSHTGLEFGAYSSQAAYYHYLTTWRHEFRCAPFFGYTYIDCRHYGVLPVNGKVTMVLSSTLTIDSINPAPDLIVGDTMIWYYDSLSYGEKFHVGGGGGYGTCISFNDPPAGVLGWYVVRDSIWDYTSGAFVAAYVDSFGCVANCSFDPNNKIVSPEGDGSQHNTPPNTLLTYTINFQNTGTDTAFNVVVVDTLDPDLDWSTFQVISSIHDVYTQMDPVTGVVTFTFENIQLPDSNVDEPNSHGAVIYEIQTDSMLPDPTEITNTSYIYFDYNLPVVTNTTLNTITVAGVPIASFTANDVSVCPGYCINFTSTPNPGSTYQWSFPGGNPSSSTDENPTNICYIVSGNYDVNLIVTNSLGADTASYQNYISVYNVASQAITQSGDTLFANPGWVTYAWYYNGNIISGATDYFYVATQNGDYHVITWDANGCDVEAAAFNVMTSVSHSNLESAISVYPNPAGDWFEIRGIHAEAVSVYNVLGERVLQNKFITGSTVHVVDITALPKGTYTVEVLSGDQTFRTSVVKQ